MSVGLCEEGVASVFGSPSKMGSHLKHTVFTGLSHGCIVLPALNQSFLGLLMTLPDVYCAVSDAFTSPYIRMSKN